MSSFMGSDSPKTLKHSGSSLALETPDSYTVALLGYSDTGKSSMVFRFMNGTFFTEVKNDPTLEDNYKKTFLVEDKMCSLNIIDTGGAVFDDMCESWIMRADGVMMVYDITNATSLKDCQKHYDRIVEVSKKKFGGKKQKIPMILVATKSDLEDSRKVTSQQGLEFAMKFGCWFKEVSAVTGQSIDLVFQVIVSRIRESLKKETTKKKKKIQESVGADTWSSPAKVSLKWTDVEVANEKPKLIDFSKAQSQGFHFEIGRDDCVYSASHPVGSIYDEDLNKPHYHQQFLGQDQENFLSNGEENASLGPVCLTLQEPGKYDTKALLRLKEEDKRIVIPANNSHSYKDMIKYLAKEVNAELAKIKLKEVTDPVFPLELVDFEQQKIITKYKVGILNVKANQKDENEMYANVEMSSDFEEFLGFMGERITLLGFEKFRGGLDVKKNTTGLQSVYTKYKSFEIMFHVAPLLPDQKDDLQRVEKKRHLGNDVVVIIFKEGPEPFDPLVLTSHFNHIFIVIQKIQGKYRVEIANHEGVPPYPPFFPKTDFEANQTFREMLLNKIINSERAAMHAPSFKGKLTRTRKMLLENLANNQLRKK